MLSGIIVRVSEVRGEGRNGDLGGWGGSLPAVGAEFSVNPGSLQSERHFGKMTKLCLHKNNKN